MGEKHEEVLANQKSAITQFRQRLSDLELAKPPGIFCCVCIPLQDTPIITLGFAFGNILKVSKAVKKMLEYLNRELAWMGIRINSDVIQG